MQAAIHTKEFELKALDFLAKTYDVRFYCLCPKSPMSNFIELAPISTNPNFILESKPKNYTKDILLPSAETYNIFGNIDTQQSFRKNMILQFLKNIYDFPRDFMEYLKYRKNRKRLMK